jgi:hypothetical protein
MLAFSGDGIGGGQTNAITITRHVPSPVPHCNHTLSRTVTRNVPVPVSHPVSIPSSCTRPYPVAVDKPYPVRIDKPVPVHVPFSFYQLFVEVHKNITSLGLLKNYIFLFYVVVSSIKNMYNIYNVLI